MENSIDQKPGEPKKPEGIPPTENGIINALDAGTVSDEALEVALVRYIYECIKEPTTAEVIVMDLIERIGSYGYLNEDLLRSVYDRALLFKAKHVAAFVKGLIDKQGK